MLMQAGMAPGALPHKSRHSHGKLLHKSLRAGWPQSLLPTEFPLSLLSYGVITGQSLHGHEHPQLLTEKLRPDKLLVLMISVMVTFRHTRSATQQYVSLGPWHDFRSALSRAGARSYI